MPGSRHRQYTKGSHFTSGHIDTDKCSRRDQTRVPALRLCPIFQAAEIENYGAMPHNVRQGFGYYRKPCFTAQDSTVHHFFQRYCTL